MYQTLKKIIQKIFVQSLFSEIWGVQESLALGCLIFTFFVKYLAL